MSELRRRIEFRDGQPGYLLFIAEGDEGAAQFLIRTHWGDSRERPAEGWDLGYHSRVYREGATEMDECPVLGHPCWYDGSTLMADRLFNRFVTSDVSVVWDELEACYRAWFGPMVAS